MTRYTRRQTFLFCFATSLVTLAVVGVFRITLWPGLRARLVQLAPASLSGEGVERWSDSTSFSQPPDSSDPKAILAVRERYADMIARRDTMIGSQGQNELIKLMFDLDVYKNMFWLGIPVIKTPDDMWMMQQLIMEVRPDFIVETGTYRGGSALYFAHVMEGIGLPDAKVITIDIRDLTAQAAERPIWQRRVEFIHGSSTDPAVVSQVKERVRDKNVILVLDSLHTREHVLAELEAYSALVPPGSYIVVEDTSLDLIPLLPDENVGAAAAVAEFLRSELGRDFEVDRSREAFLITLHPGGWLRHIE